MINKAPRTIDAADWLPPQDLFLLWPANTTLAKAAAALRIDAAFENVTLTGSVEDALLDEAMLRYDEDEPLRRAQITALREAGRIL